MLTSFSSVLRDIVQALIRIIKFNLPQIMLMSSTTETYFAYSNIAHPLPTNLLAYLFWSDNHNYHYSIISCPQWNPGNLSQLFTISGAPGVSAGPRSVVRLNRTLPLNMFKVKITKSVPKGNTSLLDWAKEQIVAREKETKEIKKQKLSLNEYFPRIFRPGSNIAVPQKYRNEMKQSSVAIQTLCNRPTDIFQVIEPIDNNLNVYGHEIRQLLLLACMEVEAALSAILRANGYHGKRWTTTDYVKLLKPLHLDEYKLRLVSYQNATSFSPFHDWPSEKPTQSLDWYNAYNKTKHDREDSFSEATLKRAIDSICAAIILFHAQFGETEQEIPKFKMFSIEQLPEFPLDEYYFFLWKNEYNTTSFNPSKITWNEVNYPF